MDARSIGKAFGRVFWSSKRDQDPMAPSSKLEDYPATRFSPNLPIVLRDRHRIPGAERNPALPRLSGGRAENAAAFCD
jgi:hypothetical protein